MTETPSASEWAAARGEKWRDQLSGMEAMLAPVNAPLIETLQLDAPLRVADIGCGGGGTALEIFRKAPALSAVHGYDISPVLIETARGRMRSDEPAIAFTLADVATAPVPPDPYDRLVSRFGIMFYDDPPAAFARLKRWLAPHGRFAFAVWGPAADNPWMSSIREVAAAFIDVPPPEPDAPGPFRYAGADKLLGLLEGAGFRNAELHDWRGALALGGGLPPAEAADFALASFSVGELLADAGPETSESVRRALTDLLASHEQDGAVWMDAHVHIIAGSA